MTKTLEELKKIINEQEAALIIKAKQQQLSLEEKEEFKKLQTRLADEEGMDQLPSVEILQQLYKPVKSFKIKSANEDDWAKIVADFEEKFGKEKNKNGTLQFTTYEEVNAFFKDQASKGRAFLAQEVNRDNYVFSDGNGHYLMGNKAEIISYCKENDIESPFDNPEESLDNSPSKNFH